MTSPEPVLRRKLQFTSLNANSNKWYEITRYPDGRVIARYGRVGDAGQETDYGIRSDGFVDTKVWEKLNKGYVEVDLHTPSANGTVVHDPATPAPVRTFVQQVFDAAGERIAQFLATSVDALSQAQIARGRQLLLKLDGLIGYSGASPYAIRQIVEDYYRTIPTQLPRRIDPDEQVQTLVKELRSGEQEQRLDQLEAAIATVQVAGTPVTQSLGAELQVLPQTAAAYGQIVDYLHRTGNQQRIRDILTVRIPPERQAWDACQVGKANIRPLFHGTRAPNLRHILRSGLIIPRLPANGRRFGDGIYFADMAKRSLNYTGGLLTTLFIADVALGNPKQLDGDRPSLKAPPPGYDSVWGIKAYSGMDEFVVFSAAQQTIRAVVVFA